jgi:hypothetical protein
LNCPYWYHDFVDPEGLTGSYGEKVWLLASRAQKIERSLNSYSCFARSIAMSCIAYYSGLNSAIEMLLHEILGNLSLLPLVSVREKLFLILEGCPMAVP